MKGIKNCPRVFQDGDELMRYREYLLTAMEGGRISREIFRRRIRRACKQYREDTEAREYYSRQRQKAGA